MDELRNILHDIWTGALAPNEIGGFVLWLIGRAFWPLFGVIIAAAGIVMGL